MSRYRLSWSNYESDKWKTKRTIKYQISQLLSLGPFSKSELIQIKDFMEEIINRKGKY